MLSREKVQFSELYSSPIFFDQATKFYILKSCVTKSGVILFVLVDIIIQKKFL